MEDRIDIPQSAWERLVSDKRKLALAIGGVVLAVALIGGLVYARAVSLEDSGSGGTVVDGGGPEDDSGSSTEGTSSAEETGAAASGETTGSTETSTPAGGSSSGGAGAGSVAVTSEPYIAFRKDGALHIAREDGSGARRLVACEDGAFALSPDAGTLAYVDAAEGRLMLLNVATGKSEGVGQALDDEISWAPDSSFMAYTSGNRQSPEVRMVKGDGSGDAHLAAGHSPRVSPDGGGILWIGDAALGQAGAVVAAPVGYTVRPSIAPNMEAAEAAFGADGVVAAVKDSSGTLSRPVTLRIDAGWKFTGEAYRDLPVAPGNTIPVALVHFCASPDGGGLSYAAAGDDGYSRTYVLDLATAKTTTLSVRRDTAPMCWSSDGSRVLFVEGNAFQGESTAVMSATPDGMGRKVIVQDGGL